MYNKVGWHLLIMALLVLVTGQRASAATANLSALQCRDQLAQAEAGGDPAGAVPSPAQYAPAPSAAGNPASPTPAPAVTPPGGVSVPDTTVPSNNDPGSPGSLAQPANGPSPNTQMPPAMNGPDTDSGGVPPLNGPGTVGGTVPPNSGSTAGTVVPAAQPGSTGGMAPVSPVGTSGAGGTASGANGPSRLPLLSSPSPTAAGTSFLSGAYTITISGKPFPIDPKQFKVRDGILLIPLRPVAVRLLADLTIDPNNQIIAVTRADDRQEVLLDAKAKKYVASGFNEPLPQNVNLIDWTPGKEQLPQNILEQMLHVYVAIDNDKREIAINPISTAFAEALSAYEIQEGSQQKQRFRLPSIRFNAFQYDNAMNTNSLTRQGQITTFRTSSQLNQNVINTYITYLGSSKGPAWRYSQAGFEIITPRRFVLLGGAYPIKTGSLFAQGINNGFIGEKYFGYATKISAVVGAQQSLLERVGLQQQRPLFRRNNALVWAIFDTGDFRNRQFFKRPIWTDHRMILGAGAGGFGDHHNGENHGGGVLAYFYARDDFQRFAGGLRLLSDFDVAASDTKREKEIGTSRLHPGGVILFRQTATVLDRITLTTLFQRGSEHWSTLDISNVYRNQFIYNQSLSITPIKGVTLFGTIGTAHAVKGNTIPTNTWAGGGNISLLPNILPDLSWTSNVQTREHTTARYFNTFFFNQPVNFLRTTISGLYLASNSGNRNTAQSNFGLNTRTTLYRNSTFFYNKQWTSPNSTNKQVGFDSGRILGNNLRVNFAVGQAVSGRQKVSNFLIGTSIGLPWIGHRVGVAYSQYGKSFQLMINLFGFLGRGNSFISANTVPTRIIPLTGKIEGRFFVDNDLSGTFDPSVDVPLPNLRVIVGNRVVGVTDKNGRYVSAELQRGFLTVTTDPSAIPASYAFLTPMSQDLFVLPGKTKIVDFRFAKLATVSGTVTAANGDMSLVRDLRVYLEGTDRDTLTDDLGRFTISDVTPGKFTVKLDPEYLQPEQEPDTGAISLTVMPGSKTRDLHLTIKTRPIQVEEKHF
jgi:hypothetical protein